MTSTYSNGPIRRFAHKHDEIPAFHAAYLVLSFLAAAILPLGFFALLIALHMALDIIKYRDIHGCSYAVTVRAVILESIVDLALLFAAAAFAVYFHHTFGMAAVSGLIRSELTIVRALGMLIPKYEILQHIVAVFMNFSTYIHDPHPHLRGRMTKGERVSGWAIGGCALAIVLAALIWDVQVVKILVEEMRLV